jgi:hypothetical protein
MVEKCHYCGLEYHPMLPATKDGEWIFVCDVRFTFDEKGDLVSILPTQECTDKAVKDGYILRWDKKRSR